MPDVLVIRHAESVWNVERRWQGQADPPLSLAGEDQARALAERVGPFHLVVSSDLERARRTAELLRRGAPHVLEPLLREYDVGAWSGMTREGIARRWPGQLERFDAGDLDAPPGAETRDDFDDRVAAAAAAVHRRADEQQAARVLVVTHGGVIRSLLRQCGRPERPVRHLSGNHAVFEGGRLVLGSEFDPSVGVSEVHVDTAPQYRRGS